MKPAIQKLVPTRLPKVKTPEDRVALIEGAGRLVFACRDFDQLYKLRAETETLLTYQRKLDSDRRALAALEGCVRISEVQLGRVLAAQKQTPTQAGKKGAKARQTKKKAPPRTEHLLSKDEASRLRKTAALSQPEIVAAVKAAESSGQTISQRETIALAKLQPRQRKSVISLVKKGASWAQARSTVGRKAVRKTNAAEEIKGRYSVILADPPWKYSNTGLAGNVHTHPELPYPPMDLEDICALPISTLPTTNAVLFLWVTNPFTVVGGPEVVRAWGFEYKTKFVWVKNRAAANGFYVRSRTEDLWICTRGKGMTVSPEMMVDNVIEEPIREHSRKPTKAYEIIEKYYPRSKKLELFARRPRKGWHVWGNEIDRLEG